MHDLTGTEYRRFYFDNVLVPHSDRRNVPDDIYHHLPGSIKGTAKHYKLPLIGLVAAMIAVMLEVTEVYRVVSLSGIFIAIGLVVLLVVTLIQTMDRIRELELARQKEARESLDYLTGLPCVIKVRH